MPNTLLTPALIGREALMNLYAQTVMLPLVHRDYSADFAGIQGDTVTVRKPAQFTAQEFTTSVTVQDATEGSVPVRLDKHLDVTFAVTAKDLTLSVTDFSQQFIAPAVEAIAQKIDQLLFSLYADTYQFTGTAGTTPSAVSDLTAVGRVLNVAKVPASERRLAVDPFAADKFQQLPSFFDASIIGDEGSALREAALGRKFGLDVIMGQNVPVHSNGDVAHSGTFAVNGAVSAGATTMNVDGSSTLTGTWKAGSLFTVAGVAGTYVVTADKAASANAMTGVTFFPAAPAGGFADNAVITRVAGHTSNLAFHRTAFAFVSRTLERPLGKSQDQVDVVDYNGLGLRVVYDYDPSTKKDTISLDLLCGVKTLDAARAVRLLG